VEHDLRKFLQCGILAYGFARVRCETCAENFLVAYSCKGRGICLSCNTKRMKAWLGRVICLAMVFGCI
ncbi:MAG: transposase zinc-binding domain-containing protein, partial [Pseudohongiella sp.]